MARSTMYVIIKPAPQLRATFSASSLPVFLFLFAHNIATAPTATTTTSETHAVTGASLNLAAMFAVPQHLRSYVTLLARAATSKTEPLGMP